MRTRIAESESLILYETCYDDLDDVLIIENDDDNQEFIFSWSKDRHKQAIENGDEAHMILWEKTSGRIAGYFLLAGLLNEDKSLEFRRIAVAIKGKGYGKEGVRFIKNLAFEKYNCHRLWLDVYDDNITAISLYLREEFKIDGVLRDCKKHGDKYRNMIIMSILEDEYNQNDNQTSQILEPKKLRK